MNDWLTFFSREKDIIEMGLERGQWKENGSWVIENIVASKYRRKIVSHQVIKLDYWIKI